MRTSVNLRFSSSAILTRGNKAVLSVFLDANLGDSLNSLWIWDSELPILFGNRRLIYRTCGISVTGS
ncbi:unnamed protein product [Rhizophagus irregularis]|nr:unnamed protein product [Rhizophagus irregularis]